MNSVDALLKEACERFGDTVAVDTSAADVSFCALEERAQQLATALRQRGVREGEVVAIIGQRSASAVAAVFGVWLSRASVMLIDDSLPEARRDLMMASGDVGLVVSCEDGSRGVLIDVNRSRPHAGEGQARTADVRDHAYVAFTSGSTGKPKGIVGSHRGLAHFLQWQVEEFAIGPGDRFLHLTNLSFDVWFRDALTPLLAGSTLCIPDGRAVDAQRMLAYLQDNEITGLHIVPSLARIWMAAADSGQSLRSLRHTFFAGEPLDDVLVREWQRLFPSCQVVNLYGPTETTLAQHFHRVPRGGQPGVQPIGSNLPGSRTYVLDVDQRPCADGIAGEMFIAAERPSHGYLVDGTVVSPFTQIEVGGRTVTGYATGDFGRRTPAGEFHILGRADEQIKIAGVRIELHEVRSVVQSHPSVRDVHVLAQDGSLTKSLVAVVQGDPAAESALHRHLTQHLPTVMVPSTLIYLPNIPKLPTGKTDRRAVSEIVRAHASSRGSWAAAEFTATKSEPATAARLERIWCEVLGRQERLVDHGSSFFDVGGTSITVVALRARIQSEFNLEFPLVRLFEHPSLKAQTNFLQETMAGRDARPTQTSDSEPAAARRRVLATRRQPRPQRTWANGLPGPEKRSHDG